VPHFDRGNVALGCGLCLVSSLAASAEEPPVLPSLQETVEVTATRLPENPLEVPASIQVVSGEELERRQVRTLADALALVSGVSIAPGGDAGPAGSVPEMMGLREFDAFLLVVDDVPWGGAFNPALATLDLTNLDRIEVVRGSAPVLYGATSFVGVIHVIHRAPGTTVPGELRASGGSYGSFGANGFSTLPSSGSWKHSVSAGYDETAYKDDRTRADRAHLLYRGEAELGAGRFRLDFATAIVDQDPASPFPRVGSSLTTLVPIDANHNPGDAQQDEDRLHLVLGYSAPVRGGDWTTTLALTRSTKNNTKGFLREDFAVPADVSNADGVRQTIDQNDLYFDTHFSKDAGHKVAFVFGIDELYGDATMNSENFEYHVNLDGSGAPSSATIPIDERPRLEDTRSFAGLYGQAIWTPVPRVRLDVGARLNLTDESRDAAIDDGSGAVARSADSRSDTRGSGSVGVSFRAWERSGDSLWLFADYRNAFKPASPFR